MPAQPPFVAYNLGVRRLTSDALARSAVDVQSLLESWDANGNGEIDPHEFRRAVGFFGFAAHDEERAAADGHAQHLGDRGAARCSDLAFSSAHPTLAPQKRAPRAAHRFRSASGHKRAARRRPRC